MRELAEEDTSGTNEPKAKKAKKADKKDGSEFFKLSDRENPNVYVQGLPTDVRGPAMHSFLQPCAVQCKSRAYVCAFQLPLVTTE